MRRLKSCLIGLCAAAAAALSASCGGGGGGHSSSGPALRCSDSTVAANVVALTCGPLVQGDIIRIAVTLGGPTFSSDIMSFHFDVVFDATELAFVSGSGAVGPLLSQGGDSPLLLASLASNDPGRLIVGISRTVQTTGVQAAAGRNTVLTFELQADPAMKFGPAPISFQNAEAFDSQGNPIASISFSDQLLLSVQ